MKGKILIGDLFEALGMDTFYAKGKADKDTVVEVTFDLAPDISLFYDNLNQAASDLGVDASTLYMRSKEKKEFKYFKGTIHYPINFKMLRAA